VDPPVVINHCVPSCCSLFAPAHPLHLLPLLFIMPACVHNNTYLCLACTTVFVVWGQAVWCGKSSCSE
jgi:hypothetical protein